MIQQKMEQTTDTKTAKRTHSRLPSVLSSHEKPTQASMSRARQNIQFVRRPWKEQPMPGIGMPIPLPGMPPMALPGQPPLPPQTPPTPSVAQSSEHQPIMQGDFVAINSDILPAQSFDGTTSSIMRDRKKYIANYLQMSQSSEHPNQVIMNLTRNSMVSSSQHSSAANPMIMRHVSNGQRTNYLDTTVETSERRYASMPRAVNNQRSVAFSSDVDPTYDEVQVESSAEQQHRVEMLKKIKKARDLVFNTASKRRSRRTAIAS